VAQYPLSATDFYLLPSK